VNREARLTVFGTSLAHLLSHAFIISFPAFLPYLTRDFAEAGLLSGVLFITYGLTQFPGGWLGDKIGEQIVLIVYLTVAGFGSIALVLIEEFNIGLLFVAAIIGLAGGLYHPVGLSLISKTFKENRGQAIGVHGVSGSIGLAAAPTIAVIVVTQTNRWNLSLLPLGFLAFFGSLFFITSRLWLHTDQTDEPTTPKPIVVKTEKSSKISRYLLFVLLMSGLNGLTFDGILAFLNQYLVYQGFTEAQAGYIASIIYGVGIGGQLVFGYLVDKRGAYMMVGVSFSLIFLAVLLFPFLHPKPLETYDSFSKAIILIYFLFFGFVIVSIQPGLNVMVAEASSEEHRGMAYGMYFFLTYGVGGLATPFVGLFADKYSPDYIFFILAGFTLGALLVLLFLIPSARNASTKIAE